jgi:L-lactate dehydrogenase complex protein LldG
MRGANARDAILAEVRKALPPAAAAPDVGAAVRSFVRTVEDPVVSFANAARAAGAYVAVTTRAQLERLTTDVAAGASRVLSLSPDVESTVAPPADPRALSDLELFVCEARLGVAENGAVWIAPSLTYERAALFLATSVAVVLERSAIVPDLHAAYARVDIAAESFGVFVAGPSKTADIEQALVIGAHGPKVLSVFVVEG